MEARPYATAGARGIAYAELPLELERAVPEWIAAREVRGGEVLRAGRVWRLGGRVVKLFGAEKPLRRGSALRAARAAERIHCVRTPRPLLALAWGSPWRVKGSLLVSEFVAGRALFDVWSSDAAAVEAFPLFLRTLHQAGVYHGDFHPENVLWDGQRWVLIDLEALRQRPPWRSWRAIAETQWARVFRALDFDARTQVLFMRYDARAQPSADDAERRVAWHRVEHAARALPPIPPAKLAEIRARLRA